MAHFLTAFAIAALIPLLVRWLMRSARSEPAGAAPDTADMFTMAPSLAQRRLVWGCLVLIVALQVALFRDALQYWELIAVFAPLFTIPFVLPVYALRRRVRVSREGLESFSPWTGRTFFAWELIEAVQFRGWGQTIRIRARNGELIVVPCTMSGTTALEQRMRERLPPSAIGDAFERYHSYLAGL